MEDKQPLPERQELHCHACGQYVQFTTDLSLDGNHVLECPNCGHEHCRVVRNGRITGDRWDSRNGSTYAAIAVTVTAVSTWTTSSTTDLYLYTSWMNSATTGTF